MRDLFEKNPFLEKVSAGKAPVGFFNYLRDTAVLDIAGTVGFDFVVIDNEHTGMERETTEKTDSGSGAESGSALCPCPGADSISYEKLHGDGRPRCPGAPYPQRGRMQDGSGGPQISAIWQCQLLQVQPCRRI